MLYFVTCSLSLSFSEVEKSSFLLLHNASSTCQYLCDQLECFEERRKVCKMRFQLVGDFNVHRFKERKQTTFHSFFFSRVDILQVKVCMEFFTNFVL